MHICPTAFAVHVQANYPLQCRDFSVSLLTTDMFSFKSNEGALQNNDTAFSSESIAGLNLTKHFNWATLLGEERPRNMLVLLGLLVSMLHLWLFTGLMKPEEDITEAKPLTMEVSMIAIPSPKKPVAEPPKPAPPPPPAEKKPPVPKKPPTPPKPVVQKTKPPAPKPVPVSEEPAEFAPFKPSEPVAAPTPASPPPTTATSSSASSSSSNAQTFTEANFRANYAHNPKPEYPAVARSRGWQGKVLLRVKVSAEGLSDDVSVEQSSGHDILDESAVEAVKKWRFIPAKRGDTPVASSVIVPIDFKLRN